MRALACLAVLLVVVLLTGERTRTHPASRRRGPTARFGGPSTAVRLRARGEEHLALGRWATTHWAPTPLRLGARTPGSVLVVGPTQSGKTTSLCAPIVAGWAGPVLAASVKGDLAAMTSGHRATLGRVQVVAPELAGTAVFDPVALAHSLPAARALARDLTVGTGAGSAAGDQAFWAALSAKLLAPLLYAANRAGGSIETVSAWVDRRQLDDPLAFLEDDPVAADALLASFSRDDRTLGSVLATTEAAIESLRAGDPVDPSALLSGSNTCYLSAPLHDQRRFRPMFAALVRQVLEAAAVRAGEGRPCRLLVLLDEAASIAPIDELDQVAATCQGQGVTLVTVWQDLAQLVARYGHKARTVVNNHTTRVLLGGLADPTLAEWLPTLTGPARADARRATALAPEELRQWPRGAAVLIAGRSPPVRLRLFGARAGGRGVVPHRHRAHRRSAT
ncbi:MAG TPA: type IV secretory system conjugative DNA transfer family protein [Acidimicrobiales bacterium]|nr:type IV secretory system conjugative DNA transfer family protein [Acidimicrobiales bacterium]